MTKAEQLYKHKEAKIILDRKYLDWFARQSHKCFVCGTSKNIEGHHIKQSSSQSKNDKQLLSLCVEHHRIGTPSPHNTPKLWREMFTLESQIDYAEKTYQRYLDETSDNK